jgi:hypothetical protein
MTSPIRTEDKELAAYIVEFLRRRNAGELDPAIRKMTVGSFEILHEELELILEHHGKPPGWIET